MINKVILMGRLGKDPEIKTFGNDNQLANLTVATSKKVKDQNGEYVDKTEWHNVTVFGNSAKYAAKLTKGTLVYLEGEIETQSYEKDGVTKYATKIIVGGYNSEFKAVGGNSQQDQNGQQQAPQQQQRQNTQQVQQTQNVQDLQSSHNPEDDLPF